MFYLLSKEGPKLFSGKLSEVNPIDFLILCECILKNIQDYDDERKGME
jgi:hypothetical protein